MKKLIFAAILLIGCLVLVRQVFADQPERITWCHCEPNGNCETLELPQAALEQAGHVDANGNPLHAGDHAGECVEPTPTLVPTPRCTPKPTATPTDTVEPTVTPTEAITPTVTPTDEVRPTPTPEPTVQPTNGPEEHHDNPQPTDKPGYMGDQFIGYPSQSGK